jgi:hypothetical protein
VWYVPLIQQLLPILQTLVGGHEDVVASLSINWLVPAPAAIARSINHVRIVIALFSWIASFRKYHSNTRQSLLKAISSHIFIPAA